MCSLLIFVTNESNKADESNGLLESNESNGLQEAAGESDGLCVTILAALFCNFCKMLYFGITTALLY